MKSRLLLFLLSLGAVFAADPTPEQSARIAAVQKLANGITYRQGETVIGDGLAKITVPEQFRFLDPKDASIVLSDIWGNPKSSGTLGALVPKGFDPLGDESWLVVITYDDDGYVKDDDAVKIDYTKMLAEMQESTREASQQRVKGRLRIGRLDRVGQTSALRCGYSQAILGQRVEIWRGKRKHTEL
jgi:uncharacterized membrane-anchored protein